MKKYGMSVDLTSCVACGACVVACKNENSVPDGFSRDWIVEKIEGTFPILKAEMYSSRCQHCEEAPCVSVCPTEASYIKDGIVLIDKEKCVGCEHCVAACPYGARYLGPDKIVDKCTFCEHRIEEGKDPACVEICPTRSLTFGDINDPKSEISKVLKKRKVKRLKTVYNTEPKFFLLEAITEKKEFNV